ncbi:MAG: triose-phosphate isomerase [Candidatus Poribacteria bacterium]|nr:triose-phosphate isomerase [Candidatus Poribacteria bacterium]
MRTPIVAGNWKLYKTISEAVEFVSALRELAADVTGVEIVIAPPFTALSAVAKVLVGSNIRLAAQDVFREEKGAFTGEVSPVMLKDAGCGYVIIGHSERRGYFGETDASVNRKAKAAHIHGLKPILCVGEKLEDRNAGNTQSVVEAQVVKGISGFSEAEILSTAIAYEPVWAIGTGITARSDQAQEVHGFIRSLLSRIYSTDSAKQVRLQYGGSVNAANTAELMAQMDVDGVLVGGASLEVESFVNIVKAAHG